ncbi:MAG: hypothetical protein ACK56I_12835, partial [bacterium]
VLLLSGNNCQMYSSIGISFKSIKHEIKSGLLADLLALHKIRRKVKTSHTSSLHKFRLKKIKYARWTLRKLKYAH